MSEPEKSERVWPTKVAEAENEYRARGAGILLCGGQSRRMGQPKGWLDIAGKPMIVRVLDALREVFDTLVIVAAPDEVLPASLQNAEVRIVHDETPFAGPLAGIARGLESLPTGKEWAYVTSCDAPLLTPKWIRFLAGCLTANIDIVLPVAEGREHPLAGVYRSGVAIGAKQLLSEDRRRPVFLTVLYPTLRITEEELRTIDPELDSLQNVNTQADYERLLARWHALHAENSIETPSSVKIGKERDAFLR